MLHKENKIYYYYLITIPSPDIKITAYVNAYNNERKNRSSSWQVLTKYKAGSYPPRKVETIIDAIKDDIKTVSMLVSRRQNVPSFVHRLIWGIESHKFSRKSSIVLFELELP